MLSNDRSIYGVKKMNLIKYSEIFESQAKKRLVEVFGYKNIMQVPRVVSVHLNMGVGEAVQDSKNLTQATSQLDLIAGQKCVVTKAKTSNAGFKIREGYAVGCKVTLRNQAMHTFNEKLTMVALASIRDFRGFKNKNFDGKGNLNFGIKDSSIFPEIDHDKIDRSFGLNVTVVTSAKTDKEAKELLKLYNFPFEE